MKMLQLQMAFILGFLGSLEFQPTSAIHHQNFSVCRRLSTQSCNTTENFKCESGKIKLSGLSYGENAQGSCVNKDSCQLETCCDRKAMMFLHNVTKDMLVYKNCSFRQECSINLADEYLSPSGFIGYMRSDVNYTCVADSKVVKICDNNVITSDQLELIFDGNESQRFNKIPGRCKCFVSTNHSNGMFRAIITDIRSGKLSSFYSSCSSVVLNIFDIEIGECEMQSFYGSGSFIIDALFPKTLIMDKLFWTSKNDVPSLVWITVIAINSSSVTVNCSAIETYPDYSSLKTEISANPTEKQTLPTKTTSQDGHTAVISNLTTIKVWGTSTDGEPTATGSSRDAGNENNIIAIFFHFVLPIAGGIILIVLVLVTVLCIRRRRNKKQILRRSVSRSNHIGKNAHPFELENADNITKSVHSYEDMTEPQSRGLNLFLDIDRDTAKEMAQGYDHITFEKLPRKRIPNYDLMTESVDIQLFDSAYSHTTSEPFSSKYFKPDGYSQISFDKTGTVEQLSVPVSTNGKSREIDDYSHIQLEPKPSVSIVNYIVKSESTINDYYSHTIIQSTDEAPGNQSSYRLRETILDDDSYSRIDFNAKQSRDVNGVETTIRIEKGNEKYNYAKVNLEHKKRKLRESMEVVQINDV